MTQAEELFHQLAKELPDGKEGKMFGALCIKTPNGKSGAMFWKDCIVVKLGAEDMKKALALKGSQLFEPMEGKQMKEWAQIPFTHKNEWKKYASISMESVKKLKKK
jgi:hypothetical protein